MPFENAAQSSVPPEGKSPEFDDRAEFYQDLKQLREKHLPAQMVRCAIIIYREAFETLQATGEWTGDLLYGAIRDEVLSSLENRGNWYRIGRARIGYVSTEFEDDEDFEEFLDEFIGLLRKPIFVNGIEIALNVDIGATHSVQAPDELDKLLFEVEASASLAAKSEQSSYKFFESESSTSSFQKDNVIGELHTAMEEDQFELYYQPIVSMEDGGLEGVEALIRWQHPERGLIYPGSFIPQAERLGLITFLGSWVLGAGIKELFRLDAEGIEVPQMSINLSPKQFRDPNLKSRIESLLDEYGLAPDRLRLEITEQAMVTDRKEAEGHLKALVELGVEVAMDDFGTGYSTLNQVTDLPLHVLKLDRSFVTEESPTKKEKTVVDIIIEGGKSMQLQTLVEGIETVEQWNWLQGAGCELAQGFYIAPGMPGSTLREWVESHKDKGESGEQPPDFPPAELVEEFLPEGFSG